MIKETLDRLLAKHSHKINKFGEAMEKMRKYQYNENESGFFVKYDNQRLIVGKVGRQLQFWIKYETDNNRFKILRVDDENLTFQIAGTLEECVEYGLEKLVENMYA